MSANRAEPDQTPVFVAIGGTGVIGSALADHLKELGIGYVSFSLLPDSGGGANRNIQIDVTTQDPTRIESEIAALAGRYTLVGILDILGVKGGIAAALATAAQTAGVPLGVISSCLLYDHDGRSVVDETCRSLQADTARFPYQREKLRIEEFWQEGEFRDWVIFRTHHILGRGSLLGCIPDHNRDPKLLSVLRSGAPLSLVKKGELQFSFIHPKDLAAAAVSVILGGEIRSAIVNLVHPDSVKAIAYYQEICLALQVPMPEPLSAQIDESDFWSSTSIDNVFRSKHDAVRNFDFDFGIKDCIRDALSIDDEAYAGLGTFMRNRIRGGH